MSVLESIFARAMSEPDFARQLFADTDRALRDYDLTAEELAQLKSVSQVQSSAMALEQRKSFSLFGEGKKVRIDFSKTDQG